MGVSTVKAKDALERANIQLIDEGAVRWPFPELLKWLNDGLRQIAILKPTAVAKPVVIPLVAGARQEIPSNATQLLSVVRNVQDAASNPPIGLAGIITVDKADMDASTPGWSDTGVWPGRKQVIHVMHDDAAPRIFWVWPPNNGTGRVEAMLAVVPNDVPQPNAFNDLAAYNTDLDIDPIYLNALVEWILHKAYQKDEQMAGNAARADRHLALFAESLGIRQQQEAARPPKPGMEGN